MNGLRSVGGPLLTAAAYYCGAILAFLVGTFSDQIYAPFWPPNVFLFYALTVVPLGRWPLYIATVFPAHVMAETWVAMPADQMVIAFLTNVAVAGVAAVAFKNRFPVRLFDLPGRLVSLILIATTVPAIVAFAGAVVRILGGLDPSQYWTFWMQWYVGNALAFLTLGSVLVTWLRPRVPALASPWRQAEAAIVGIAIVSACVVSVRLGPSMESSGLLPAIQYLPLPFVLWAAVRFGEAGASSAVLIVSIASIASALNGPSLFFATDPEHTVLALQLYLIVIALAVLSLGASIDELHSAQRRTVWLARSLLSSRDEERRRISRELHDSTGQNLIAASMIVDQIAMEAPYSSSTQLDKLRGSIQQSIRELRTLSYLLHPPFLDEGGLKLALDNFLEGFAQRSGITVDTEIDLPEHRLSRPMELILFRVVQEALTNIARHSESPRARLQLSQSDARTIELVVEDFGKGIDGLIDGRHSDGAIPSGIGISSMRERLTQIDGRLEISSRVGQTIIRATIPI